MPMAMFEGEFQRGIRDNFTNDGLTTNIKLNKTLDYQ